MKLCSKRVWMTTLFSFLFMAACVTINIYFPAEKVESAAEEIVKDIRGEEPSGQDKTLNNEKGSFLNRNFFAFSCDLAWAAEEEKVVSVSNPTIRALKEEMKARYKKMKPFYQKGILKDNDRGFVSIEDTSGLDLKEKRDIKALVDAENSDRERLYKEVAKALNIDPGEIDKVAEIFAKEWQKTTGNE